MAAVLEFPQLAENDGVAEMDVGRRGVDPQLHAERPALLQLLPQRALGEGVNRISKQKIRIFGHGRNARLARSTDGPVGCRPSSSGRLLSSCTRVGARAHMQKTIAEPTARLIQRRLPPVEPPPVDPFGGDGGGEGPSEPPKLKKLRVAFVAAGLGFIAFISTVFGMMMAVASDIPALENEVQFEKAENSTLLWDTGDDPDRQLATLTGNDNRILVEEHEISPYIKNAVIAIEDKRFYEHRGVDYQGIGRALWQDVLAGGAEQGASTITQQFVKNALAAQGDRSVFQKLREAAAAYHLERKWSKQKILTQYLNSIYFGNGAYGIESAMRTYFGEEEGILDENGDPVVPLDPTTGEPIETDEIAAARATPAQAALLAGMIASPSAYDPLQDPAAAKARRDLVLQQHARAGDDQPGAVRRGHQLD